MPRRSLGDELSVTHSLPVPEGPTQATSGGQSSPEWHPAPKAVFSVVRHVPATTVPTTPEQWLSEKSQ
jgi:hypothetical protein